MDIYPTTTTNTTTTTSSNNDDKIKVAIRVRPLNSKEIDQKIPWNVNSDSISLVKLPNTVIQSFFYDYVFGIESKTQDLYDAIAKNIVKSSLEGINGTIFAYGMTSSGKTFSMKGNEQSPGIIRLAIQDIFKFISESTDQREYVLKVSYLEIYNEEIKDLLSMDHQNKKLKIHEDIYRGIFVGNLKEEIVKSKADILNLMKLGDERRHIGSTNMNDNSSRSHTLFRLQIQSNCKQTGALQLSILTLVDLAGSERVASTGAEGVRLKEGTHINKSLLTLSTVISKLSEQSERPGKEIHIPYRDSKLTRILQTSLGGNSKTAIICTIAPANDYQEESIQTLQFAKRAKSVKTNYKINEVLDVNAIFKKKDMELSKIKSELTKRDDAYKMLLEKYNILLTDQTNKQWLTSSKRLLPPPYKPIPLSQSTEEMGPSNTDFEGLDKDNNDTSDRPKKKRRETIASCFSSFGSMATPISLPSSKKLLVLDQRVFQETPMKFPSISKGSSRRESVIDENDQEILETDLMEEEVEMEIDYVRMKKEDYELLVQQTEQNNLLLQEYEEVSQLLEAENTQNKSDLARLVENYRKTYKVAKSLQRQLYVDRLENGGLHESLGLLGSQYYQLQMEFEKLLNSYNQSKEEITSMKEEKVQFLEIWEPVQEQIHQVTQENQHYKSIIIDLESKYNLLLESIESNQNIVVEQATVASNQVDPMIQEQLMQLQLECSQHSQIVDKFKLENEQLSDTIKQLQESESDVVSQLKLEIQQSIDQLAQLQSENEHYSETIKQLKESESDVIGQLKLDIQKYVDNVNQLKEQETELVTVMEFDKQEYFKVNDQLKLQIQETMEQLAKLQECESEIISKLKSENQQYVDTISKLNEQESELVSKLKLDYQELDSKLKESKEDTVSKIAGLEKEIERLRNSYKEVTILNDTSTNLNQELSIKLAELEVSQKDQHKIHDLEYKLEHVNLTCIDLAKELEDKIVEYHELSIDHTQSCEEILNLENLLKSRQQQHQSVTDDLESQLQLKSEKIEQLNFTLEEMKIKLDNAEKLEKESKDSHFNELQLVNEQLQERCYSLGQLSTITMNQLWNDRKQSEGLMQIEYQELMGKYQLIYSKFSQFISKSIERQVQHESVGQESMDVFKQLQEAQEKLVEEKLKLENTILVLNKELEIRTMELENTQSQQESVGKESMDVIKQLQETQEKLVKEKEQLEIEIINLDKELEQRKLELVNIQSEQEVALKKSEDLIEQLQESQEKLVKDKEQLEDELRDLGKELEQRNQEMNNFSTQALESSKQITILLHSIEELKDANNKLQEELVVAKSKPEVPTSAVKPTVAKKVPSTPSSSASSGLGKVTVDREKEMLRKEFEKSKEKLTSLESKLKQASQEKGTLQSEKTQLEKELKDQKRLYTETEKQLEKLKATHLAADVKQKEFQTLNKQVETLTKTLDTMKVTQNELESDNQRKDQDLEKKMDLINQITLDRDAKEKKIQSLQSDLDIATIKIGNIEQVQQQTLLQAQDLKNKLVDCEKREEEIGKKLQVAIQQSQEQLESQSKQAREQLDLQTKQSQDELERLSKVSKEQLEQQMTQSQEHLNREMKLAREQLDMHVKQSQEQLALVQLEKENLTKQYNEETEKITSQLTDSYFSFEETKAEWQLKESESQQQIQQKLDQLKESQVLVQSLTEEKDQMKESYETTMKQLQEQHQEVEKQMDLKLQEIQMQKEQLESSVSAQQETISKLMVDVKERDDQIQQIENTLIDVKFNLESVQNEMNEKTLQYNADLDKLKSTQENELKALQESHLVETNKLQEQLVELQQKHSGELSKLQENANQDSEQLQNTVMSLEKKLKESSNSLNQLGKQLKSTTDQLAEKDNEINLLQDKVLEVIDQMDEKDRQLQEKQSSIQNLTLKFDSDLLKITEEHRDEIQKLKEDFDNKESEYLDRVENQMHIEKELSKSKSNLKIYTEKVTNLNQVIQKLQQGQGPDDQPNQQQITIKPIVRGPLVNSSGQPIKSILKKKQESENSTTSSPPPTQKEKENVNNININNNNPTGKALGSKPTQVVTSLSQIPQNKKVRLIIQGNGSSSSIYNPLNPAHK
ncbi:kinesin-7 [Tieghemostelium lacteum]|uniref:Kinesin-7 n=1 Tax=Tieghemostelium lacteum TaxID=361077 RepID=A0A151ZSD0_TIELA|nr:kinesin-7 [Tieghemostelium lacteum]|eukprot:KYQ96848.1 kinesin-7 [Tieghemostelium lacteum]